MFPNIRWCQALEGLARRPYITGNDVYVVVFDQYSREFQLKSFNRENGKMQWVCPMPAGGYASLAADDKQVYMACGYTRLSAINRETGRPVWTHDFQSRLRCTPILFKKQLIIVTANRFVILDPINGHILKEKIMPGKFLFGQVTIVDDTAIFLGCDNPDGNGSRLVIIALDLEDLSIKWETAIGRGYVVSSDTSGLAADERFVYCGDADGRIHAVKISDGTLIWTTDTRDSIAYRSAPHLANGRLYVGNLAGDLFALDPLTGDLLWKTSLSPEGIWCSPANVDTTVIAHAGNDLYFLDADSGKILSSIPIGHGPYTGITIAENEIYMCGGDPPDYAILFRIELEKENPSVLQNINVNWDQKTRDLSVTFELQLPPSEVPIQVTADMRPIGGSQREILSDIGNRKYSFTRRVPEAKLFGTCALVVYIETNKKIRYQTIGCNFKIDDSIPRRHLITDVHIKPQEAVDYSGPAVIQALLSRVGKEVTTEEIYKKGSFIVESGLDPHHKWRTGAQRIFHSRTGPFIEAIGGNVTPDKLFT